MMNSSKICNILSLPACDAMNASFPNLAAGLPSPGSMGVSGAPPGAASNPPTRPSRPRATSLGSSADDYASAPRKKKDHQWGERAQVGFGEPATRPPMYTAGAPYERPVPYYEPHNDVIDAADEDYVDRQFLYCYMCSQRFILEDDWRLHQSTHARSALPHDYYSNTFAQNYDNFPRHYYDGENEFVHVGIAELFVYGLTIGIALFLLFAVASRDLSSI